MHIVWTILIGFVVGLVAKLLTPGTGPAGFFLTAALGIAGSLLATYVGHFLAGTKPESLRGSLVVWSEPSSCWACITFSSERVRRRFN